MHTAACRAGVCIPRAGKKGGSSGIWWDGGLRCSSSTERLDDHAGSSHVAGLIASNNDCYRAGVEAWRHQHSDQSAEYAAKQAVAVILATHVKIRIEE
jgi:hypothetical protein